MISIDCEVAHLEFRHHVNVIGGEDGTGFDSATKKTFLFSVLEDYYNRKKLKSNRQLVFLRAPVSADSINITENTCIVMDEANFSPSDLEQLYRKVKKENAYMIVIGRLFVKQFEYAVNAIYLLQYNDPVFSIQQTFSNCNAEKEVSGIYTEDSTSVAAVYTTYLKQEVMPVGGKDRFYTLIKDKKYPILIADKPKFGPSLLNLLYRVADNHKSVQVIYGFFIESFEQVVLSIVSNDYEKVLEKAKLSFDSENYLEEYLKTNYNFWDKAKLITSLEEIKKLYNFNNSSLLEDLEKFIKDPTFVSENTYVINVANESIKAERYYAELMHKNIAELEQKQIENGLLQETTKISQSNFFSNK